MSEKYRYYKNRDKKLILILHRKVGISYFLKHNFLDKVIIKSEPKNLILNYDQWTKINIVRNPFDRFIALYNDKIVSNPQKRLLRNVSKLQLCQKLLISANKVKHLNEINFEMFSKSLRILIDKDNHFRSMYQLSFYNNVDIYDTLLKLEDQPEIIKFFKDYRINLNIKNLEREYNNNIFKNYSINDFLTIASIYENDWKYFYPIIYKQIKNYTIIYKNGIIQEITLEDPIERVLNIREIKYIKNSFLNLFINYTDEQHNLYCSLLK
jgi:hypothetical protein